jgi:hypothetical protein
MQVDSDYRSAESVPGNHFFACFSASVSYNKGQSRGREIRARLFGTVVVATVKNPEVPKHLQMKEIE